MHSDISCSGHWTWSQQGELAVHAKARGAQVLHGPDDCKEEDVWAHLQFCLSLNSCSCLKQGLCLAHELAVALPEELHEACIQASLNVSNIC